MVSVDVNGSGFQMSGKVSLCAANSIGQEQVNRDQEGDVISKVMQNSQSYLFFPCTKHCEVFVRIIYSPDNLTFRCSRDGRTTINVAGANGLVESVSSGQ